MSKVGLAVALLSVFVVVSTFVAEAEPPDVRTSPAHRFTLIDASPFVVNDVLPGDQGDPLAWMDRSTRRFVVGWNTGLSFTLGDGSGTGVKLRWFGAQAQPLAPEHAANTITNGNQLFTGISGYDDGLTLTAGVVWQGPDGDQNGAFGNFFHNGTAQSTEDILINLDPAGDDTSPDVALFMKLGSLRGGVTFEGWSRTGLEEAKTDVLWRPGLYDRVGPYGGARKSRPTSGPTARGTDPISGPEFQVNTYTTGYQGRPSTCGWEGGEFVVVWVSFGQDSTVSSLLGRMGEVDVGPVGSEFQVNSNTVASQDFPEVCCSDDGFVVAWQNGSTPPVDGSNASVSARRFDRVGRAVGDEFLVHQYTTGPQAGAAVGCDGAGNFVISWVQADFFDPGFFIRGFDTNGQPLTDDSEVTRTVRRGDVAMADDGTALVAWSEAGVGSSTFDILAQRFQTPGIAPGAGVCGDPVQPGAQGQLARTRVITATDALFVLQAAVGAVACPLCECDVNGSGAVTATDALLDLQFAVGQPITLSCPAC